uniref:RING-CH-type domain-containing protein n=1 Tax=Caenorhabditis japonica TaxID=281687 RepID=A0A8R1E1S8_CAEJA
MVRRRNRIKKAMDTEAVPLKYCKFCFGTEEDDGQQSFVHPCRCRGTIHCSKSCVFNASESFFMEKRRDIIRTRYQKRLTLKSWQDWLLPRINADRWCVVEMILDVWFTYRTLNAFKGMMDGSRGIFRGLILCTMWKCSVATSRRFCYYGSLALKFASSIFNVNIDDYDDRREIKASLPSDMHWEQITQAAVLQ